MLTPEHAFGPQVAPGVKSFGAGEKIDVTALYKGENRPWEDTDVMWRAAVAAMATVVTLLALCADAGARTFRVYTCTIRDQDAHLGPTIGYPGLQSGWD